VRLGVITLFPEIFQALHYGITGRAIERQLLQVDCINPRDYATDRHQTVDDRPYGGGPGMVLKAPILQEAVKAAKAKAGPLAKVCYLSPQGQRFNHQHAANMVTTGGLILVCGRYEGVDERFIETQVDEEWSIGDYVLSGGEFAALVMIDAMARLLPGALGDEGSAAGDSFFAGILDYPHYTRPEVYEGQAVPDVLLSGNHEAIRRWRLQQALARTYQRRPDLLEKTVLTPEQEAVLNLVKGRGEEK